VEDGKGGVYQEITPGNKETQFPDLYTLMKRRNPETIVEDERNEARQGLGMYSTVQYEAAFEPDGKWKPLGSSEDDSKRRCSYGAGAFDASWDLNRRDYGRERDDWNLLPKGKHTRKSTGGGEDGEDGEDEEDGEDGEDGDGSEDGEDGDGSDGSEDEDVPLSQLAAEIRDEQMRADRVDHVNMERARNESVESFRELQSRPQHGGGSSTQPPKNRSNAEGKKRVPPPPKSPASSGGGSPAPKRSSGSAAGSSKKQQKTGASLRAKLTQILLGRHRVNRA
jgi:hypothetical protein